MLWNDWGKSKRKVKNDFGQLEKPVRTGKDALEQLITLTQILRRSS